MLDKDGYPEMNVYNLIQDWKFDKPDSFVKLMELIKENWNYADIGYFHNKGRVYWLSTAGWSGNESLISALEDNLVFWAICWVSSRRGGHHKFILPAKSFRNIGTNGVLIVTVIL